MEYNLIDKIKELYETRQAIEPKQIQRRALNNRPTPQWDGSVEQLQEILNHKKENDEFNKEMGVLQEREKTLMYAVYAIFKELNLDHNVASTLHYQDNLFLRIWTSSGPEVNIEEIHR